MKFFKLQVTAIRPYTLSSGRVVRKTNKKTLFFIMINMRHFTVFDESSLEFVK